MWLWRRVCGEPLESEIRAILALTMSRRSGGRLAPYTSSDVARFTNMLLSLWLSPWGELGRVNDLLPGVSMRVRPESAVGWCNSIAGKRRGVRCAGHPSERR